MSDLDLGIKLFLQLVVILAACRIVGWVGKKLFGQTQVVMEMVAGVLLGPSLLGLISPQAKDFLFPSTLTLASGEVIRHPSMQILYVISQVGLVLYMFLIGNEFDLNLIKNRVGSVVSVSLAGIVLPFALGVLLAFTIAGSANFFEGHVSQWEGALYLGAAMCITAFPMLARIIYESGLSKTRVGTLALGAGAMDDAFAWCLLAVVLASNKSTPMIAIASIGGGIAFGILTMTFGRAMLARLATWEARERDITPPIFVTVMAVVMLGAWFTDAIGIYAVFGAFIVGAAMPKGEFAEKLRTRIEPLTVGLLLPLFFVFSGLNTQIGLVDSPYLWGLTAIVILAAIIGKGLGCTLAARVAGEPWRESLTIGTLMNARGLMELIILNIGLQQGIITPTLFTIMVLMAIVTTLMASPLYKWLYGKQLAALKAGPGGPATAMP